MYKDAAIRGFMIADKYGMDITDERRNDYAKVIKQ